MNDAVDRQRKMARLNGQDTNTWAVISTVLWGVFAVGVLIGYVIGRLV